MKYKEIVCDYCHKTAIVPTLRKANYCDECKSIAHTQAVKISKEKKEIGQIVGELKQMYDPTEYMYQDIIEELLQRYADLRKDTYYWWDKIKKTVKHYTKSGDMLLHQLEIGGLSQQQILAITEKVELDRRKRRGGKNSDAILFVMLCSLGLRDPIKFGKVAFDGAKTEKDFHTYLDNMQYDQSIFANAKRREKRIDEKTEV